MKFQNSPDITRRFAAINVLENFEISPAVLIPYTLRKHAIMQTRYKIPFHKPFPPQQTINGIDSSMLLRHCTHFFISKAQSKNVQQD